ncbi:hypothetical protein COP1_044289 [Malus domestica]
MKSSSKPSARNARLARRMSSTGARWRASNPPQLRRARKKPRSGRRLPRGSLRLADWRIWRRMSSKRRIRRCWRRNRMR